MDLTAKRVVVIGGTSGIGAAVAERLRDVEPRP
jgi:NAD(P)-dependent dehydrogenase (short-subunit alcohol dehydrogenase family)